MKTAAGVWKGNGAPAKSAMPLAAVLTCAVGFGIDLSEFAVGNALSAIFSAGPARLGAVELALLVGAAYAGAAVGAPFFGRLGDRYGDRRILVVALIWIGLSTLAGAASGSTAVLTSTRFLAGLALGGYPPLMIAYLRDAAPSGHERRVVLATCAVAYLGPPAMLFGIRSLTPIVPFGIDGWRWGLGVAGVMALCASLGLAMLPPVRQVPRRVILPRGGVKLAPTAHETAPSVEDDIAPRFRHIGGRLAVYASGYAAVAVATIAFPLVTGPVLLARGIGLNETLFYVGLGSLGPFLATLAASALIDRISRRAALVGAAFVMLAGVLLFFSGGGAGVLIASVVTFAIGMALYLPLIAAHGAETFPTHVRALATSMGWACNRIAAAVTPLAALPLARSGHPVLVETLLCASLLLTVALLVLERGYGVPVAVRSPAARYTSG